MLSEAATLFLLFQSYHEFANYLCREVFTDMSVLPLVFPSNISCFSRGSYKVIATPEIQWGVSNLSFYSQEELARKRELPVPPQPRRTGVLARSDDNLAGETRPEPLGITFTLNTHPKAHHDSESHHLVPLC